MKIYLRQNFKSESYLSPAQRDIKIISIFAWQFIVPII